MINQIRKKENDSAMSDTKKYVLFNVYAYGLFWISLLIVFCLIATGVINMSAEDGDGFLTQLVGLPGSWAPTIAFIILYKKFFPGSTVKEFYQKAFKGRLNISLIAVATLVHVAIFLISCFIVSVQKDISVASLFDISLTTIGTGFFWSVIKGAASEETGWRGFMQPSMEKKHGVIITGLIVGIVWSFWHLPLWFLTGLSGWDLIIYILSFIVGVTAFSVVMGICYYHCKNLLVPVYMHFLFNFCLKLYTGDDSNVLFFTWFSIFYVIATIGYSYWHLKVSKKN